MTDTHDTNLPDKPVELEEDKKTAEVSEPATTETPAEVTLTDKPAESVQKLTKEEILNKLKAIAADVENAAKSEIDGLKQAFYKLHNSEQEAAKKLFVENGGTIEEFVPQADTLEEEFKNTMSVIKEKRNALNAEQEKQKEQEKVNSLIEDTQKKIQESSEKIEDAQSDVESIDAKIEKMIEYEKQLEIQKAKEDAARLAAIKKQEQENRSNVTYAPAQSDAYLLAAIIQCEAWGESYDGKLAVGSVIMNRVRSSYFPNTVSGVIYQGGQFSPVASGRLAYRLEQGVASDCMSAAQAVLGGTSTTNCLYFRVNNGIIEGTVIGNHVFY